jgi:hypothetical protein
MFKDIIEIAQQCETAEERKAIYAYAIQKAGEVRYQHAFACLEEQYHGDLVRVQAFLDTLKRDQSKGPTKYTMIEAVECYINYTKEKPTAQRLEEEAASH